MSTDSTPIASDEALSESAFQRAWAALCSAAGLTHVVEGSEVGPEARLEWPVPVIGPLALVFDRVDLRLWSRTFSTSPESRVELRLRKDDAEMHYEVGRIVWDPAAGVWRWSVQDKHAGSEGLARPPQ